jgi:hypothetical protein
MVGFSYNDSTLVGQTMLRGFSLELHKGAVVFSNVGELELVPRAVGFQSLFVTVIIRMGEAVKFTAMYKDETTALEEAVIYILSKDGNV